MNTIREKIKQNKRLTNKECDFLDALIDIYELKCFRYLGMLRNAARTYGFDHWKVIRLSKETFDEIDKLRWDRYYKLEDELFRKRLRQWQKEVK